LPIPGGQFYRSYDALTFTDQAHPASVTGFSLDKYEVSVGRFRQFVSAVVASWRPAASSGKRTDLNLGKGRVNVGPAGGNEAGWDAAWDAQLASSTASWKTNLACADGATWTATAGKNERLPITCVNWYEALAFCIWDEGRLPSEAEWNEAASGGMEQRVYPWSSPASSPTIDCAHANYHGAPGPDYCVSPGTGAANAVGAESPLGDGRWGHADLAGNVFEWVLDWDAPYTPSCPDCIYFDDLPNHVIRGGSYNNDAPFLLSSARRASGTADRAGNIGVRCAR
jgi:formylglycine-generating enzyme required for sulfatase activity